MTQGLSVAGEEGELIMNSLQGKPRWKQWLPGVVLILFTAGIAAGTARQVAGNSAAGLVEAAQIKRTPAPHPRVPVNASVEPENPPEGLTPKQIRELRKERFSQMKQHADELVDMASSLQKDLNESNENVFSLQIIEKAGKIEKLAKKIREEAKLGY